MPSKKERAPPKRRGPLEGSVKPPAGDPKRQKGESAGVGRPCDAEEAAVSLLRMNGNDDAVAPLPQQPAVMANAIPESTSTAAAGDADTSTKKKKRKQTPRWSPTNIKRMLRKVKEPD